MPKQDGESDGDSVLGASSFVHTLLKGWSKARLESAAGEIVRVMGNRKNKTPLEQAVYAGNGVRTWTGRGEDCFSCWLTKKCFPRLIFARNVSNPRRCGLFRAVFVLPSTGWRVLNQGTSDSCSTNDIKLAPMVRTLESQLRSPLLVVAPRQRSSSRINLQFCACESSLRVGILIPISTCFSASDAGAFGGLPSGSTNPQTSLSKLHKPKQPQITVGHPETGVESCIPITNPALHSHAPYR
jgi:hypothetical protein